MVTNVRYKTRIMSRKKDVHFGRVQKCDARLRLMFSSTETRNILTRFLLAYCISQSGLQCFICYRVIAEFFIQLNVSFLKGHIRLRHYTLTPF